ncbi:conserved hypothetical integral membrane protein [Gulbenkiania indica]|uniref:Conserved hypothetical integral membrane protein n=1 Tax=Gulbenkiania indica TaxID=375574 RepID=A0A0K6GTJ7_9NEIS|nr:YeiH family putative sulfate export transporter [Gulbenkiania indica]CUA81878.1 conserved hypothetical integral membrane protein [Gulbenkiania indica]
MNALRLVLPGLSLSVAIALLADWSARLPGPQSLGLSALTLAILGGMLLGHTVYPRLADMCTAGVALAKTRLLRLGIVLYGFRLTFQAVTTVGWAGVLIDALVLSSTFLLAWQVGRRLLGVDEESVILIGAGSAICGAAAVLATEPVVRAAPERVTVAVSTVVVFGTLAMFLYPVLHALGSTWGISDFAFGMFTGSTVHEVAQAVAAGRAISETAATSAVITKLLRVMMLAPFLMLLSAWLAGRSSRAQRPSARIALPWFALGFLVVTGFNSLALLPAPVTATLVTLDNLLLATAMAALGLTTHLSAFRLAGPRPLLLAAVLFLWLVAGGSLINATVLRLMP